MKTALPIPLLAILLSFACSHAEEKPAERSSQGSEAPKAGDETTGPADADARAKIVGTWHEEFESVEAQVRYVGDTTYRGDGTFHVDGKMNYQGEDMEAVGGGTYRIEGGEICYTFTEGSGPMGENLGQEVCEKLLEVSESQVRYRDHNDEKTTVMTRVNAPEPT